MRFLITITFMLFSIVLIGQEIDSNKSNKFDTVDYEFSGLVYLDSVVVLASRNGFNVKDFIEMVQKDNSFYKAFKNLHFAEYDFNNHIYFYNKKGEIRSELKSSSHQCYRNNCRWMNTIKEDINYKIYKKNNKHKYYTAKLYDRLFFTNGKICDEDTSRALKMQKENGSKMEKYVLELKKLIFSPGKKVDIPLIGSKMEIFSPKMRKFYNFSINHVMYKNKIPCYVFSAKIKPEYINSGKTVINYINTYFEKDNFQIISRNYHLKYNTIAYDFDVKMDIKLKRIKEKYYPVDIRYDGTWDVLFKKRETCKFSTKVFNIQQDI